MRRMLTDKEIEFLQSLLDKVLYNEDTNTIEVGTNQEVDGDLQVNGDINADNIQEKLTAGDNIQISDENVISATDTKYTAGGGISISDENVISANAGEIWESFISLGIGSQGRIGIHLYTKEQLTNDNYYNILLAEFNQNKIIPAIPDIYEDLPTIDTDTKFLVTGIWYSPVGNLTLRGFNIVNGVLDPTLTTIVSYLSQSNSLRYSHKIN